MIQEGDKTESTIGDQKEHGDDLCHNINTPDGHKNQRDGTGDHRSIHRLMMPRILLTHLLADRIGRELSRAIA